ncbi:MAG: citramalate synthase [Deltaproteobacteria bacterium]|nr:citramalate synthase [Deltaproteobacteria bacterium]
MRQVQIYDTTLRDGTQAEYFNLSLADKIRIARKLAELGFHYIEGGWPGSNPKDEEFFEEIRNYNLGLTRVAAFGSTHHKDRPPESDPVFQELLISRAPVVTIFGKSSVFQVKEILQTTLERNLALITDSLAYLKPRVEELFYDAEHFFDGFKEDREYALKTLEAAVTGGADCLVLCDTNGGTLTSELIGIIKAVIKRLPKAPLGIHAHNDSEMAVANSLAAVELGCVQVQGTVNGFGERCGNANLISVIPALKLKMGIGCLADESLKRLTELSRFVYELANIHPNRYQPYVGQSAFAHKGGVHAAAVKRNPKAYEHVNPEVVGNVRAIPVSDLSGRGNILLKAQEMGLEAADHDRAVQAAMKRLDELLAVSDLKLPPPESSIKMALEKIKELEAEGYQFETADASLELLLMGALGGYYKEYFKLVSYRVIDQKAGEDVPPTPEASIRVKVGLHEVHTAALGNGPVDALYNAMLKALVRFYPRLTEMRLEDYKVRVLPGMAGTSAKVRVNIESRDANDWWGTVGVSSDIIEASWQALVDSINYKLYKDEKRSK